MELLQWGQEGGNNEIENNLNRMGDSGDYLVSIYPIGTLHTQ